MTCLVLALASCTVPPIDLEGRPCPCLEGYACDSATSTCVRSFGDGTSCLASGAGASLYESGFDDLAGWVHDAGSWTAQGGTAVQSDNMSNFAYAYQPAVTVADYRIVSTFRVVSGVGNATAAELAARVQLDGSGGQYHCNWDPANGAFQIMYSSSPTQNGFLQSVFIDTSRIPDYDPKAWFTMELQVRGSRIDCCLRGVGGAAGFANDTQFATGAPGLKTFMVAAAYDDFRVSSVQ